jgi:hypothetical protein
MRFIDSLIIGIESVDYDFDSGSADPGKLRNQAI